MSRTGPAHVSRQEMVKQHMRPVNDRNYLREFFSNMASDSIYDATIDLVVPYYKLLHETVVRLLRNHFVDTREQLLVMDIGSGTGEATINILRAFPTAHVVAIDFCPEMHAALRANYESKVGNQADFEERCTPIEADCLSDAWDIRDCLAAIPLRWRATRPRVVVSTFTVHHFNHIEKSKAYERMYELLSSGGLLINGDLFSYQSTSLAKQALSFDLDWIDQQFENPPEDRAKARMIPLNRRRELAAYWKEHYLSHNCLEPLDTRNERTSGNVGQRQMLFDIGFLQVEVPFRFWQIGVLWAHKQ